MKINLRISTLLFLHIFCAGCSAQTISNDSDIWLEGRLQGALDFNSYLESADIDAKVTGDKVNLSGEVPSYIYKNFAEKISQKLSPNKKIVSNIRVNPGILLRSRTDLEQYLKDEGIAAIIKSMLSSSKIANASKITVNVKDQKAVLDGTAGSDEVKNHAANIAFSVTDVKMVINNLTVETANPLADNIEIKESQPLKELVVNDAWITSQIKFLIQHTKNLSGLDVIIYVKNGNVKLSGKQQYSKQISQLSGLVSDIIGVTGLTQEISN